MRSSTAKPHFTQKEVSSKTLASDIASSDIFCEDFLLSLVSEIQSQELSRITLQSNHYRPLFVLEYLIIILS